MARSGDLPGAPRQLTTRDVASNSADRAPNGDLSADGRVQYTCSETTRFRDEAAARRDRIAGERDAAALARDRLAELLDSEVARIDDEIIIEAERLGGESGPLRALIERAVASRARSAAQREAAAFDRERAGHDRRQAARDRSAAAAEIAAEGLDHLTGTMRRRVGLHAIQAEMDRTRRSKEGLVIAFVDVDGLKRVNDTMGHAAGDEVLRDVTQTIRAHLRSYDVILRHGGDEFVCSLSSVSVGDARSRFATIAEALVKTRHATSVGVGFAERRSGDSLNALVRRADRDLTRGRSGRGT